MIGTDRNKEYHLMRAAIAYAEIIKQVATCHRAKYACVITDTDLRVLSYGFNGVAKGIPNGCLRPDYDKPCERCQGTGRLKRMANVMHDAAFPDEVTEEKCPHCDDESQIGNVVVSGCGCIHAEANAVMALRNSQHDGPIIAFVTGEPCEACAMLLLNAGCVMVVYSRASHRKYGGTDLLDSAKIPHGHPTEMSALLVAYGHKFKV